MRGCRTFQQTNCSTDDLCSVNLLPRIKNLITFKHKIRLNDDSENKLISSHYKENYKENHEIETNFYKPKQLVTIKIKTEIF